MAYTANDQRHGRRNNLGRITTAALIGVSGGIAIFIMRLTLDGDSGRSALFGIVFAVVAFILGLILTSSRFTKNDGENGEREND